MAEPLPLELITEILTKLPVKSLNRFKCVSKTWNSLINASKFIKHHLRQTLISNTNTNIIITSITSKIIISNISILSSAISDVELHFDIVNHPLNNLPHSPPVDIVKSVHGLLLIFDSSKKTVCLFNPSNKTQRLIPPAPSHKPACYSSKFADVFGFGYDSVTDDYKVVRLVQWISKISGVYREAYVYSLRNDSWGSVNDETSVSYTLQDINAIAVEEILCFAASARDSKPAVKGFDLRTSTFSLVDYPELDTYDFAKLTMSVGNLRGFLCLVLNYQEHKVDPAKFMGNPLFNRLFVYVDVWELKEFGKKESWVKLFRIRKYEIQEDCFIFRHVRLVTYSKDEKSVLVEVDSAWLGWYDLVTKKIKRVSVQGLRLEDSPFVALTYMGSLVSVKNDKAVSKKKGATARKTIDKNDFLSSGFKLKL